MPLILLFILFLCWGSFLNVVAYRLLRGENLARPRSHCPCCKTPIAWYDNIPVFSWIVLRSKCRHCHKPISLLYPLIELMTAVVLTLLYALTPITYFPAYFIFFSALLVSFRSDIETMLISQWVTVFILPLGPLFALAKLLPITLLESVAGAVLGYLFLWLVAKIFTLLTHKEGMGAGDFELLAFIGAFLGVVGCWLTLLIASVLGSIIGIILIVIWRERSMKIPFGPFLVTGAILITLARFIVWLP